MRLWLPGRCRATTSDDFDISDEGMLSFKASPDFETPTDADTDNIYQVTVQASAGGEMGEVERHRNRHQRGRDGDESVGGDGHDGAAGWRT